MKSLLLLIFGLTVVLSLFSQKEVKSNYPTLSPLSSVQQSELGSLPQLKLPLEYKNKTVPYEVDNTIQSCYSGLFLQTQYCCGQAACVANGFTYEINRIRELDGSLVENKYPTHFTWNWENGGEGYHGVSYYHSLIVLKTVGNPNMQTYGGTHDFGGSTRFMTGYDNYYAAMQNRLNQAYSINCSTEEGIQDLKHWINDHIDGSTVGGIGFFYSQHQNPSTVLPDDTEHAGEKVCVTWGASPNHAMTITGYNDSIRWDYNGDGQYTNDIDINGDDIVDVRDWEIGGFKMCNTYGSPYDGWMMYRSLALADNEGGIWNNTVNVIYPVKDYSPSLTYKVAMYYTNRSRIKVIAGISTNLSATEPDFYMTFPIFNYQGGEYGMQGANDETSREIEFGLDVTPLLSVIPSGTDVKFFFQLIENDTEAWGAGTIHNFSVIDYSSGSPIEYVSTDTEIEIVHNGVTTLSVQHSPVYTSPSITTNVLPNANVYSLYEHQMEAESGTPPYRWEFDMDYAITEQSTPHEDATTAISAGLVNLPFEFSFYGETFDYFYLNAKGYIDFSGESYSLPYNSNALTSNSVSFMNRKCIAPFISNTNCTAYFTSGTDYYVIKWIGTNIDVSLKIQSDGNISIFYNNCTPTNDQVWASGFSFGNLLNYSLTPQSGAITTISSIGYDYYPIEAPEIFTLSEDGLLSGTPMTELLAYPLNFKITDARGLVNKKTIPISTEGLIVECSISTINNNLIEWGENVIMDLGVRNATELPMNNLNVTISCGNPDVTINDAIEIIPILNSLEELNFATAFNFDLNYNFYNEQVITFHLVAECDENTWELDLEYPVYTADIQLEEYFVDDLDNNRLDIGETTDLYYTFANDGGAEIADLDVTVSSSDPFLTINNNHDDLGLMLPSNSANAYFNFTADAACLPGHVAVLNFTLTGANGFEKNIVGYVSIGQILEDWETGNLDTYSWNNGGDLPWVISEFEPLEGTYCLKSGAITHDQNSNLEIELQVIAPGTISFNRKISCENHADDNYDYLAFYIDDIERGRWDSIYDWELQSYNVAAGVHNFKWVYHKDGSVNFGDDCAYIDLIEFPSIYDAEPLLTLSETEIIKTMYPNQLATDTLFVSNQGGGIITYNIEIFDDVPWLRSQKSILGSYMTCSETSFYAGDTVEWVFTVKNTSPDNEWIEEISIDFPTGFLVETITDMYDQTEDTLLLIAGEPGNGSDFTWFGENADGWGLIGVNELATTTVEAIIDTHFYDNMVIHYILQGEIYAGEPHTVTDSIVLTNYGQRIEWLATTDIQGDLGIGEEHAIALDFSSYDLEPGEYNCNINIFASCDTIVVPVTLFVETASAITNNENNNLKIFPNPTKTYFFIESDVEFNHLEIVNTLGQIVYSNNEIQQKLKINAKDLMPGIYFVSIFTDAEILTKKLIVK